MIRLLFNDTNKQSMHNLPGPNESTSCELLLPLKDESSKKHTNQLYIKLYITTHIIF